MLRKVKYSNEKKIKVAELEISRFQVELEREPYYLMQYPVDFLKVNDDEKLIFFECKILIETQKWQIAIKEKFDKLLTSSKNPNLTKRLFDDLPTMLSEKVLATHVFILNNLIQNDWKDSITDYIDYVVDSFGKVPNPLMVPAGMNEYLIYLQDELSSKGWEKYTKGFEDRICFVLNYITKTYVKNEIESDNFESLIRIYNKWYHEFPFDLQLFSEIKNKYSSTLPILKKKPRINPYLGIEVFTFFTESEMLDFLITITKTTLEAFKSKDLVKKRIEYVRNDTKFNLDLENKIHLSNQEKLVEEYSFGRLSYKGLINKWYATEMKYLKRVLKKFKLNSDFQSFKIQVSEESNKWSYDRLKDFKESLIDQNFIKPIAPSSFKRIFSGEKINKQIVWKSSTINLAYMIIQLINIEIGIDEKGEKSKVKLLEPAPQKHWDITSRCFKKENGLRFLPSNFRKLDPPTEINKSKLDSALKHLHLTVTS